MLRKFLYASILLALPISVHAQSNYAVVRGSVYHQQHRALPGPPSRLNRQPRVPSAKLPQIKMAYMRWPDCFPANISCMSSTLDLLRPISACNWK